MIFRKSPLEPYKEEAKAPKAKKAEKTKKAKAPKAKKAEKTKKAEDNAFLTSTIEKYPTGKELLKKMAKDEEAEAKLKAGEL